MVRVLQSGRSIMWVAVAWNVFDALVHVAIDQIDVLRMAGNVLVLVATLTYVVKPGMPRAIVAAGAA